VAKKPIVFVVDDEVENVQLMVRTLGATYDVRDFVDARAALEAAKEARPNCVVVDQRMPHMSGVDLLKAIRDAGIQCAGLIVTGYLDDEEVATTRNSGLVFQTIPKPWNVDDLGRQVQLAISSCRFVFGGVPPQDLSGLPWAERPP